MQPLSRYRRETNRCRGCSPQAARCASALGWKPAARRSASNWTVLMPPRGRLKSAYRKAGDFTLAVRQRDRRRQSEGAAAKSAGCKYNAMAPRSPEESDCGFEPAWANWMQSGDFGPHSYRAISNGYRRIARLTAPVRLAPSIPRPVCRTSLELTPRGTHSRKLATASWRPQAHWSVIRPNSSPLWRSEDWSVPRPPPEHSV